MSSLEVVCLINNYMEMVCVRFQMCVAVLMCIRLIRLHRYMMEVHRLLVHAYWYYMIVCGVFFLGKEAYNFSLLIKV